MCGGGIITGLGETQGHHSAGKEGKASRQRWHLEGGRSGSEMVPSTACGKKYGGDWGGNRAPPEVGGGGPEALEMTGSRGAEGRFN